LRRIPQRLPALLRQVPSIKLGIITSAHKAGETTLVVTSDVYSSPYVDFVHDSVFSAVFVLSLSAWALRTQVEEGSVNI
jgi:hypothetical protein